MKLEITKDRVLEAASKCSTAKETLKTLFPEAFKSDKYFNFSGIPTNFLEGYNLPYGFSYDDLAVRTNGEYTAKGFYLSESFDWEIVRDEYDSKVLIPTRKVK